MIISNSKQREAVPTRSFYSSLRAVDVDAAAAAAAGGGGGGGGGEEEEEEEEGLPTQQEHLMATKETDRLLLILLKCNVSLLKIQISEKLQSDFKFSITRNGIRVVTKKKS
jgi:hypothetical protein